MSPGLLVGCVLSVAFMLFCIVLIILRNETNDKDDDDDGDITPTAPSPYGMSPRSKVCMR